MAHYSKEACIVHIADIFAHASGHEVLLVNEIPELQIKAWQELGLSEDVIAPTIQKVEGEFREIVKVFFGGSAPQDAVVD